jgi:hypothetical protein
VKKIAIKSKYFINKMIVNKEIFNDSINTKQLFCIFQFYQFFKILVHNPIILFGSIVRNWIIPCYYYDLNPFKYTSLVELLEKDNFGYINIPTEFDIWLKGSKWKNNQIIDNCIHRLRNSGYKAKIKFKTTKNKYDVRFVYCEPEFGDRSFFVLKFYETSRFQSVDFDVNNICMKCSEENGLDTIKILTTFGEIEKDTDGFGYTRNKQTFICNAVMNIMIKRCKLICIENKEYSIVITRNYLLERIEKMLLDGYIIDNFKLVEPVQELKDTCSICLEHNSNTIILKLLCGHEFHMNCLFPYWKTNQNEQQIEVPPSVRCPNCRRVDSLW